MNINIKSLNFVCLAACSNGYAVKITANEASNPIKLKLAAVKVNVRLTLRKL